MLKHAGFYREAVAPQNLTLQLLEPVVVGGNRSDVVQFSGSS